MLFLLITSYLFTFFFSFRKILIHSILVLIRQRLFFIKTYNGSSVNAFNIKQTHAFIHYLFFKGKQLIIIFKKEKKNKETDYVLNIKTR